MKLVKNSSNKYVVVKENDFQFCRLRRTDNPEIGHLKSLWEGNNLRTGYNAMIKINNENKEAKKRVFAIVNTKGNLIFKECIYPDKIEKPWQEIFNIQLDENYKKVIKDHWKKKLETLKQKAQIGHSSKLSINDIRYLCWKYKEDPNNLFLP
jgi:hypothetical protein